jgi:hypothetical protein
VSLVDVGLAGRLGNLGGRFGEPRLAVSLVNVGLGGRPAGLDVLRGVLGGVGRRVHGHAACGVLREGLLLVRTLGISGSFSSPYLAACCLAFLAAFLALLVTSLVMDMSGTGWLETSSTMLQTWLLMQRDSLPASFLLLHMVSVLRAASWEVLRAASSEVLRAASMEVLRADSSEDRGIFCLLGGLSASSEDFLLTLALIPTGRDLVCSP